MKYILSFLLSVTVMFCSAQSKTKIDSTITLKLTEQQAIWLYQNTNAGLPSWSERNDLTALQASQAARFISDSVMQRIAAWYNLRHPGPAVQPKKDSAAKKP